MNKFFACLIILSISGISNAGGGLRGSRGDIDNPMGYKKTSQGFVVDNYDGSSSQCQKCGLFWAKSCRSRDNINAKRTNELCDLEYRPTTQDSGYCDTSHGPFFCIDGYYKDRPHDDQPQGCQDCVELTPPP